MLDFGTDSSGTFGSLGVIIKERQYGIHLVNRATAGMVTRFKFAARVKEAAGGCLLPEKLGGKGVSEVSHVGISIALRQVKKSPENVGGLRCA